ncbi:MAG: nucleotide sugar dehydrogenase, partial [Candidatus Cloacimonetes bacterium]|nr:nucleotide sugar dehydrogenase [Candidatus Cloacimonadota bacterium]
MNHQNLTIGVVGLGYVGLPLLISFAKHYKMVGFDISKRKIQNLLSGHDDTNEVGNDAIKNTKAS